MLRRITISTTWGKGRCIGGKGVRWWKRSDGSAKELSAQGTSQSTSWVSGRTMLMVGSLSPAPRQHLGPEGSSDPPSPIGAALDPTSRQAISDHQRYSGMPPLSCSSKHRTGHRVGAGLWPYHQMHHSDSSSTPDSPTAPDRRILSALFTDFVLAGGHIHLRHLGLSPLYQIFDCRLYGQVLGIPLVRAE